MSVAQDLFLGLVGSVEAGILTPEEAVTELAELKQEYGFYSEYTLEDFQRLRTNYLSKLESEEDNDYYEDDFRYDEDEEDDE
jgi:hypothetical protein